MEWSKNHLTFCPFQRSWLGADSQHLQYQRRKLSFINLSIFLVFSNKLEYTPAEKLWLLVSFLTLGRRFLFLKLLTMLFDLTIVVSSFLEPFPTPGKFWFWSLFRSQIRNRIQTIRYLAVLNLNKISCLFYVKCSTVSLESCHLIFDFLTFLTFVIHSMIRNRNALRFRFWFNKGLTLRFRYRFHNTGGKVPKDMFYFLFVIVPLRLVLLALSISTAWIFGVILLLFTDWRTTFTTEHKSV